MFKQVINIIIGIIIEVGAIALVMLICFGISWLFAV